MRPLSLPSLLLSALIGLASVELTSAQTVPINGIAAKVNGRVITQNEVALSVSPIRKQLEAEHPIIDEEGKLREGHEEFKKKLYDASQKILNELIVRELILDEYKDFARNIPDHAIDNEIKQNIARLYNGDKTKLHEELREKRMTMNGYRQMQKEMLVVQLVRRQMSDESAPPLPGEIQSEYNLAKNEYRDFSKDTVTYRQVFIPALNPRDSTVTRESQLALAKKLANEIKDGKNIAEIAKEHSNDANADNGGLRENVPRFEIAAEFAEVIFNTKEGDVVGPIGDKNGFYIIKPEKIELGPAPPLSEIRENIEMRLRSKKSAAQFDSWIKKRLQRAMIQIKI